MTSIKMTSHVRDVRYATLYPTHTGPHLQNAPLVCSHCCCGFCSTFTSSSSASSLPWYTKESVAATWPEPEGSLLASLQNADSISRTSRSAAVSRAPRCGRRAGDLRGS